MTRPPLTELTLPSGARLAVTLCTVSGGPYVRVSTGGENVIYIRAADFEEFTRGMQMASAQVVA